MSDSRCGVIQGCYKSSAFSSVDRFGYATYADNGNWSIGQKMENDLTKLATEQHIDKLIGFIVMCLENIIHTINLL